MKAWGQGVQGECGDGQGLARGETHAGAMTGVEV